LSNWGIASGVRPAGPVAHVAHPQAPSAIALAGQRDSMESADAATDYAPIARNVIAELSSNPATSLSRLE